MLPLPQTLTSNTALLNGEASPAKGFSVDTAATYGSPGFADTLRATVPAPTSPSSQGDASGNSLPQSGKTLPQTNEPPFTGPIKLPGIIPEGVALADSDSLQLDAVPLGQGLDLSRLLNRLAGRAVLPAVAGVGSDVHGTDAQAGMPVVNLSEVVEDLALPAAPLPAGDELRLAQPALYTTPVPVTVPGNPLPDSQAGNMPLVRSNAANTERGGERSAQPLPVTPQLPLSSERMTARAAELAPDLMQAFGAHRSAALVAGKGQSPALAPPGAALANAATRSAEALPLKSQTVQAMPLELAGAERPLAREPGVSTVLPVTRDPVASAVAQQLTTAVVRPDAAALDLQRGITPRPGSIATPQSATALTAVNDTLQMAQPAPAPHATMTATSQPRAEVTSAMTANTNTHPAKALTDTARRLQGSATAIDAVAAPTPKSANVPAATVVPAAVASPVVSNAAPMPVVKQASPEAVTAELVPTTAKADIQPATPAPTTVGTAAAPTLPSVAAPTTSPATTLPPLSLPVTDSAWGDALGERVMVLASQKLTSADIRLNPAELGPLRVEIKVDDGNTQIHFTAQHAVTREAIEQALPRLRELLSAEGLNLTGADVSESGVRRDQGQQSQSAGRDGLARNENAGEELEGAEGADDAASRARSRDGLVDTFA